MVLHPDFADRVEQMSGTGSITLRVSVGGDIPGFTTDETLVEGQPTTEPPDRVLGLPIVVLVGHDGAAQGRHPAALARTSTPRWPPTP